MYDINKDTIAQKVAWLVQQKHEGAYWDYKEEWHHNKARLLHDILCMLNNLQEEDGYIIFGVKDNGDVCGVEPSDPNRNKQADIVDWISHIKFASDVPAIRVFTDVLCLDKKLDVIFLPQENKGPYFLKEEYKRDKVTVLPVIYTRFGDTNTPIKESATFHQVETLWRKRLGLLHNVQEKAVKYIYDVNNWAFIDSNDKEDAVWYYKGDPAYTVSTSEIDDSDDIESDKDIKFEFYYLCTFLNVGYHPGISFENAFLRYNNLRLFEGLLAMVDECRTKVIDNLGFFVKGTLEHGMYEFVFAHMCRDYSDDAKKQIETVIPIYENESERERFEEFIKQKGWNSFYRFLGTHTGEFENAMDSYSVLTPKVIGGFSENGRNIEELLDLQSQGEIINFYNEHNFSESEQIEISRRIKEGYILVQWLNQWRNSRND
jgi:hypothetical protein